MAKISQVHPLLRFLQLITMEFKLHRNRKNHARGRKNKIQQKVAYLRMNCIGN